MTFANRAATSSVGASGGGNSPLNTSPGNLSGIPGTALIRFCFTHRRIVCVDFRSAVATSAVVKSPLAETLMDSYSFICTNEPM